MSVSSTHRPPQCTEPTSCPALLSCQILLSFPVVHMVLLISLMYDLFGLLRTVVFVSGLFCLLFCLCGAFIFSSVLRKLKITFHCYPDDIKNKNFWFWFWDDTQVYVPVKYKDAYSLHTLTTILSTVCILSNPDPPQCKKPCVQIID